MLKTPAISPAGEFRRVNAFGALDLRIVSSATQGEMAVWETIVAPEASPPLHVHYAEDETFYVLAGIFSITIGERSIVASPGATMFLPRGIPHTFKNIGGTVGRILCMATPGGFEEFFLEVERTGASEPAEIAAIGKKYSLEFVQPGAIQPANTNVYEDALSG
jgi:mannose-6-phosphate isomerase-like protein (cupin superfamily)